MKRYYSIKTASITTASFRQDLLQMETALMTIITLNDEQDSIAYINKLSDQIVNDLTMLMQ